MPRLPQHIVIWSQEHQHYELHTHGQLISCFSQEDDAAFLRWVAEHTTFAFVGQAGRLSVLKETRVHGSGYWYAYSTHAQRARKRYLGGSNRVTFVCLEQEAKALTLSPSPVPLAFTPPLQAPPPTPSQTMKEQEAPKTQVTPQKKQRGELLPTKLAPSRLPLSLVKRDRLLTALQSAYSYPLTLVSASAGSGKTTLLAAWMTAAKRLSADERTGGPAQPAFAWLSFDVLDNDPIRFWFSVVAALRTCLPSLGEADFTLFHTQESFPSPLLVTHLLQKVEQANRTVVLILDDYHVISDPALQQEVLFLLEHLPACLHLVLATRTDPAFPLARWRARGQMLEIRDHELRFRHTETTKFLTQCMCLPLTDDEVTILQRRTEGWITGLHLAAIALRKCEDRSAFVKDFVGTHRFVLDYVQQDILAHLPKALQDFILQTAILKNMNAAVCQAVTSLPNQQVSQQILEELEQANLLVVSLDEQRQWYRYHDLFREALVARLQASHPEQVSLLHDRAARWYGTVGNMREAMAHALKAADHTYTAHLVEQAAKQLWFSGEAHLVHDWVQALPDVVLWQYIPLALEASLRLLNEVHESTQEVYVRAQAQVEQALARISRGLGTQQPHMYSMAERGLVERRMHLLRALLEMRAILTRGDRVRLRKLTQEIEKLPKDEEVIWKMVPLSFTFWLTMMFLDREGEVLPRLREIKQQALQAGDELATLQVRIWLALADVLDGQLHQAHQECQEALAWIEHTQVRTAMVGYLYRVLFDVFYSWNRLEEAETALGHLQRIGQERHQADLLFIGEINAGLLALARKDLSIVQEALLRHEALVEREGLSNRMALRSRLLVQYWLAERNSAQISAWAAQTTFFLEVGNPLLLWDVLMWVRVTLVQQHYLRAIQMLHHWSWYFDQPGRRSFTIEFLALQMVTLHHAGEREQARAIAARLFSLTEPEGFVRVYMDAGELMKQALQALLETVQDTAGLLSQHYIAYLLSNFEQEKWRSTLPGKGDTALIPRTRSFSPQRDIRSIPFEPLSPQERKVLDRLCTGQTYAEIAEALIVSPNTIKTQVSSIYRKLGVSRRAEAIAARSALLHEKSYPRV